MFVKSWTDNKTVVVQGCEVFDMKAIAEMHPDERQDKMKEMNQVLAHDPCPEVCFAGQLQCAMLN